MSNRTVTGILLALAAGVFAITPVLAQGFYVNPGNPYGDPYASPYGSPYASPYGNPYYNNYAYRGYAPPGAYGYYHHRNHTVRDMAIGAGIGAGIGLLASHHGHRY